MKKIIFSVALLISSLLLVIGCNYVDKSSITSVMKTPVEIEAFIILSNKGEINVKGTSNLPDNTSLLISLSNSKFNYWAQDKTIILNGVFTAGPFSSKNGLKAGEYSVGVTMPVSSVQPKAVQIAIGDMGQYLTGEYVVDSLFAGNVVEKTFYYTVE